LPNGDLMATESTLR